jgi:hypothetical protein
MPAFAGTYGREVTRLRHPRAGGLHVLRAVYATPVPRIEIAKYRVLDCNSAMDAIHRPVTERSQLYSVVDASRAVQGNQGVIA